MNADLCSECIKIFNRDPSFYKTKYSASENSSSIRINNKYASVCCIKIKGIFDINTSHKNCDYLFVIKESDIKLFLFVELKGGSVNGKEAAKQLINTIDFFREKYNTPSENDRIEGVIVGGKYTNDMIRMKSDFRKKYGGELRHKSGHKQSYEFL